MQKRSVSNWWAIIDVALSADIGIHKSLPATPLTTTNDATIALAPVRVSETAEGTFNAAGTDNNSKSKVNVMNGKSGNNQFRVACCSLEIVLWIIVQIYERKPFKIGVNNGMLLFNIVL